MPDKIGEVSAGVKLFDLFCEFDAVDAGINQPIPVDVLPATIDPKIAVGGFSLLDTCCFYVLK